MFSIKIYPATRSRKILIRLLLVSFLIFLALYESCMYIFTPRGYCRKVRSNPTKKYHDFKSLSLPAGLVGELHFLNDLYFFYDYNYPYPGSMSNTSSKFLPTSLFLSLFPVKLHEVSWSKIIASRKDAFWIFRRREIHFFPCSRLESGCRKRIRICWYYTIFICSHSFIFMECIINFCDPYRSWNLRTIF